MKKILIGYLIDGKNSGIDNYILNVIDQIKNDNVKIDCLTNHIDNELKSRLDKLGVGLLEIPTLKHPYSHYCAMKAIIRKGKYDIAYFNISEAFNSLGLLAAHRCDVKKIVVHSHSSGVNSHSKTVRYIKTFCHTIMKHLIVGRCATDFYTCSYVAGEWMFPKNVLSSQKFHIMNNAVKVERFKFSEEIRHKKRVELDLENRIIIGQVGAFSYQKNSEFVVDIAEALHRKNPKTMVLMIGTGSDFDEINKRVKERKLENAVRLMGSRKDVNELMQAMDIFILPSRFEGLPIVAIEAQVSGLKVIISDRISKETALSERCKFLSISESADKWAEAILSNIYYDRDSLNLSECKYCFDVVQQNNAIKEIFNF